MKTKQPPTNMQPKKSKSVHRKVSTHTRKRKRFSSIYNGACPAEGGCITYPHRTRHQ